MAKKRETLGILSPDVIRMWDIPRVDKKVLAGFQELKDVAGLAARALDQLGIAGTVPATRLPPLSPGMRVVGHAITVRSLPERDIPYRYWERGDLTQLGEREAFFLAKEGDVIAIDGSSVYPASNLGSFSAALAYRLGARGIVVDGAVTGVDLIRTVGIGVWSRGGTTVTGHHRLETAEINGPIGIQGVRCEPGDLICADDSGVTVVPRKAAPDALAICRRGRDIHAQVRQMATQGASREDLRRAVGGTMKTYSAASKKKGAKKR